MQMQKTMPESLRSEQLLAPSHIQSHSHCTRYHKLPSATHSPRGVSMPKVQASRWQSSGQHEDEKRAPSFLAEYWAPNTLAVGALAYGFCANFAGVSHADRVVGSLKYAQELFRRHVLWPR